MKIQLSQLLAIAKGMKNPYTGSENDPEAVRKHFADGGYSSFTLSDGSTVDIARVEIELPAAKSLSIGDLARPEKVEQPADTSIAIKAAVEAELARQKTLNIDTKRPGFAEFRDEDEKPEKIKVRSSAQQAWDAYSAAQGGGTFFKSLDRALLFRDYFLTNGLPMKAHRDADWRGGIESAQSRLKGGFHGKAYATFPNAAGGALTATEFVPELIQNVNQFGVSNSLVRLIPMAEKRMEIPVATGIPVARWPEEAVANTDDTAEVFSNVQLDAKTAVITAKVSRQVVQDAYIPLIDFFASEFARGFAYARDQILFNGNATPTFGGMTGLKTAFGNLGTLSTVATNGGGVVTGAASAGAYTAAQFSEVVALCPAYALPNAKWSVTPRFWAANMQRLGLAQGGSTAMEMVNGVPRFRFMGFPVVFNNVVNTAWTDAANTIDCYFGDISRAVVTGDRMSFEFDTNESVYFNSYAVGVRGVERYHTVVHDVGTGTAPGPVIALIQS